MESKNTSSARQPGYSWATPCFPVGDIEKAVAFYTEKLGFTVQKLAKDGKGTALFAHICYEDVSFMLGPDDQTDGTFSPSPEKTGNVSPCYYYLYHENVDELYKKLKADGSVNIIQEINDAFWGDRVFTVKDPFGYVWHFAKNIGEFDPTKAPKEWS